LPLDWMPAARYQQFWHQMGAFALPSFYDGRVRINLRGRERSGIIDSAHYGKFRDELVTTLTECRDIFTGETIVEDVEYPAAADPAKIGNTEADLVILWRGAPMGLVHWKHGHVGPIPYRRTGGHTGGPGFAFVHSEGFPPGDYGTRSAYDVVPTFFELLGKPPPECLSGRSLMTNRQQVP
jgi:predicted AlkP superfamily phosphohydrolase/phosphomutase